ncbi:uncharacterized protein LOC144685211 [Cetorhinus maximus]
MNNYGIFITPDKISYPWADYEFDTDVTNNEYSFSDGAHGRNYKNLDDGLKESHTFEEVPEAKANEKRDTSLPKGKKPTLCQLSQREPHPGRMDEPDLEQIILECAKAVESFVGSQDLSDVEVEPKLQSVVHADSEGLDGVWALQRPQVKDSEQFVDEVTEHLTEYLVEETLDELTRIREQQNQSTKDLWKERLDGHRITQDYTKFAQQKSGLLKGQRGHDKSFVDVELLRINCVQLKDQMSIKKGICHEEATENVTENLIAKFIDDAANVYTQIKRSSDGKFDTNCIPCPQTAVDCLTPHNEAFNMGIFGSSQNVDVEKFKGLQSSQDRKTPAQRFGLDHWCSGLWRQSKETVFAVPYNIVDVQQLVGNAINVLWNQRGNFQDSDEINVFEAQEYTDQKDADTVSKGVHKQAIFHLTSGIFQKVLMKEPTPNQYPWLKHKPWVGLASGHVPNTEDKRDVKSFIQGKVAKLLNLDNNDLEMKRKLQKLTKYCKSKRDRVDIILIQELQEEEGRWVEYADDELTVKMKLTEDIFNILVHDTVDVLNLICDRRSAGQTLTASSTQQLKVSQN